MMKNKKAWLRIVEAFLAVLIITGVLLTIVVKQPQQNRNSEIHNMQRLILNQISLNDTLRAEILNNQKSGTESFISEIKPVYWNYTIEICNVKDVCGMSNYPSSEVGKEIYAEEMIISSTLEEYNPKKLKLFIWTK